MNRYSVAAFVWFASTVLIAVQGMAQVEFGVGPIVGMNFGTLSFSPDSYSPVVQYPSTGGAQIGRTGLIFGVQTEVGFSRLCSIVFQPCYVEKGYAVTGSIGTLALEINEIEIPVLFKLKFLDGDFRPYLFVGPNVGFVLTARENYSFPPQDLSSRDFKDKAHVDFAIDIGGGVGYSVTPSMVIMADVRYSLGIANVMNSGQFMESPPVTTKASGFQIVIGVLFHAM